MNASTLIASYLWKDIWRQWRNNPISVLARLAVSGFLFVLALSIDLYFAGAERTLTKQLEDTGLGRVVVTHFTFGHRLLELDAGLGPRLDRLRLDGRYVYLRRVPQQAMVELVGETDLMIYRDQDLADLRVFFPGIERTAAFLLSSRKDLPAGTRLSARIETTELKVHVLPVNSAQIETLGRDEAVLFPASWAPQLSRSGYVEIVLFESGTSEPSAIRKQIKTIRHLLTLDGITGANFQSGLQILERLESLRQQQALWSAAVRSIVAGLIILVFASTAFLEYRENAYLSALLQSLGVSRLFLFLRYLLEHALLLLFGFSLAVGILAVMLNKPTIFPLEVSGDLSSLLSYQKAIKAWSTVLILTLLLSLAPILIGLRREIGRILQ